MKFYRYPDLVDMGIVNNRMTLSRLVKTGRFPAPAKLGRMILWDSEVIDAWRQSLRADTPAASA